MNNESESALIAELVGLTIVGFRVAVDEHVFDLSNGGKVVSGGLWRLLVKGTIVATEYDVGKAHWDPKAKPMNLQIEEQLHANLFNKAISDAWVTSPTGDLSIRVPGGVTLQFIKLHSFLESWEVLCPDWHLLVDAWGKVHQWGAATDG